MKHVRLITDVIAAATTAASASAAAHREQRHVPPSRALSIEFSAGGSVERGFSSL